MARNYKQSQQQLVIEVLAAVNTTTTIQAFGSGDNFTNPATEFADDETIAIAGSLTATDGADLTGILMSVTIDGGAPTTTPLYGFTGGVNFFQLQLGVLSIGSHTIIASFPRTRR